MGNITFGSDIESFIVKDNIVQSSQVLGEDFRVKYPEGVVERDGYAIEIQPAHGTVNDVFENTRAILSKLSKDIKPFDIYPDSVVFVDTKVLQEMGDQKALIFGCKPDFNGYKKGANKKPDAEKYPSRTAGGHIHFGDPNIKVKSNTYGDYTLYFPFSEDDKNNIRNKLMLLDMVLGLYSVLLDKPSKRRELYGKAGDHRVTSYGFEYRTLSNFFILNPIVFKNVFDLAEKCIILSNDKNANEIMTVVGKHEIIKTINSCDIVTANELFKEVVKRLGIDTSGLLQPLDFNLNIFKEWSV